MLACSHTYTPLPQSPSLLSQDETRDKKRRATNPRTGGRPTLELAGNDPRTAGHRYFLTWRVSWRPAGTTPGYCPRSVPCGAPHRGRGHFTSEPYVASEVACGHSPLVFPSVPSVLPRGKRRHALRRHALRRHALRRHALLAQILVSRIRGSPAGLWTSVFLSNQLLINTTSGHGIHATASRPSQLKVSQRRQTPAGLDAGGMTTMPETPVKCHHTRWQSSRPPSCTRLISQRLDAASVELWSATHWLPVG